MTGKLKEVKSCPVCNGIEYDIAFKKENFTGKLCSNCGLVFISPVLEDSHGLYTDDKSSSPSKYYRLSYHSDYKTFIRRIKLIEKYTVKGSILDIGCSTGNFMEAAMKNGWENVCGVEPNPVSANECKKKNLKVIEGFADKELVKKIQDAFDAIYIGDVIEHVENPVEILNIVNRILGGEGIIMIVTPNFDSFIVRKLQIKPYEHLLYFNETSLRNLLKICGFNIEYFTKTTREHSMIALKYSTTFSSRSFLRMLLNIFYIPGAEYLANIFFRFFVKDELLAIARRNNSNNL